MKPSLSSSEHRFPRVDGSRLPTLLKAAAFWAAVILPFALLGLLASGLQTNVEYVLLAALLVANVLALVVGHDYRT